MPRKPPSAPSERDIEIYYDCRARNKTQRAVAEQRGISQPRVNQIVRRVGDFIAETKSLQHYTVDKAMYLARDIYGVVLHDFECLARDTFVEQHQWCREAHKDQTQRRPPRADARLITIGMAALKDQVDNFEHKAKLAASIKQTKAEADRRQRELEKRAEQERQNALSKSESLCSNAATSQELQHDLSPYQTAVSDAVVEQSSPPEVIESPVAMPTETPVETPVAEPVVASPAGGKVKTSRRKTATWDELFPRKPATPMKFRDPRAIRWENQPYRPSWQLPSPCDP